MLHTTDPNVPPSVVRMASTPHGTVILARGVASVHQGGPQDIPDTNILSFFFGEPRPKKTDFNAARRGLPRSSRWPTSRPSSPTAWAAWAGLPEPDRVAAVCADLGIGAVKAHNRRRRLTLPEQLRRSLTRDQGAELAAHPALARLMPSRRQT